MVEFKMSLCGWFPINLINPINYPVVHVRMHLSLLGESQGMRMAL